MPAYMWLPRALDFIEMYQIERDLVESVIDNPTKTRVHPASGSHGYRIMGYRRGDIEACVSYENPNDPVVVYVYLHLPFAINAVPRSAGGRGGSPHAPRDLQDLEARIQASGYRLSRGGKHTRVIRRNGSYMMSLPITPSDRRSILNAWRTFVRLDVLGSLDNDPAPDTAEKTPDGASLARSETPTPGGEPT